MTNQSPTDNDHRTRYAIESRGLGFRWPAARDELRFPDIQLEQGQHLFLRGPSGSGKSTLLSLLSGLSRIQRGELRIVEQSVNTLSGSQLDRLRADHLGVIFQQFNLVPYLSPLGNTQLPCTLSSRRRQHAQPTPEREACALLASLAIPESHWHQPVARLSVGQQQRVAAARALIGSPALILADEPTSALDRDNRDRFIDLLLAQAEARQTSVLMVSHDDQLAGHFHQQQRLENRG